MTRTQRIRGDRIAIAAALGATVLACSASAALAGNAVVFSTINPHFTFAFPNVAGVGTDWTVTGTKKATVVEFEDGTKLRLDPDHWSWAFVEGDFPDTFDPRSAE